MRQRARQASIIENMKHLLQVKIETQYESIYCPTVEAVFISGVSY